MLLLCGLRLCRTTIRDAGAPPGVAALLHNNLLLHNNFTSTFRRSVL